MKRVRNTAVKFGYELWLRMCFQVGPSKPRSTLYRLDAKGSRKNKLIFNNRTINKGGRGKGHAINEKITI